MFILLGEMIQFDQYFSNGLKPPPWITSVFVQWLWASKIPCKPFANIHRRWPSCFLGATETTNTPWIITYIHKYVYIYTHICRRAYIYILYIYIIYIYDILHTTQERHQWLIPSSCPAGKVVSPGCQRDPENTYEMLYLRIKQLPGDSKWPFHPLAGDHLAI